MRYILRALGALDSVGVLWLCLVVALVIATLVFAFAWIADWSDARAKLRKPRNGRSNVRPMVSRLDVPKKLEALSGKLAAKGKR